MDKIDLILHEFQKVHSKLDSIETKMDRLETRMDSLEARIDNIEKNIAADLSVDKIAAAMNIPRNRLFRIFR